MRAIVTGGGSGIGRATALALAGRGYDVAVSYNHNQQGAEEVVAEIEMAGRRARAVKLDLTEPAEADRAMTGLLETFGGPDVLVNNAGVNPRVPSLDETRDGWIECLNANLIGPWACAQAVARDMIARGRPGRIVNVTSILAFVPLEGGAAYCAAKSALEMLTKVMALELAPHGIAVNAVAPGHTATPMNYSPAELKGGPIQRPVIPLRRAAAADEVAAAIAFLATDAASYSTGSSLLVDGGLMLASGPQELQNTTGLPESARTDRA